MPKQVDIAAQKQMIAEAAIRVITKSGLEGTRLRDVARAGNVTTGAVTHYFDGKEAVLEAALEEIVRRTLARIDVPAKPESRGDLPAFIRRVCRYLPLDDEGCGEWRVWLAFWGRAIADERLRAIHKEYYSAFVERIAGYLKALDGAPQDEQAARAMADALIAAIDGIGTRATLEPDDWPAKRQKDTLTALLTPLLENFCRQ